MNFFDKIGRVAIGSRLRMLTEKITEDSSKIYALYDVGLQPKWFPVFYTLAEEESKTITEIARKIGHSHPSVSMIVGEMVKKGLITESKDKADGRRNRVSLSEKGKELTLKIQDQLLDTENAIDVLGKQTQHDLWKAIEEWEFLLEQKSLLQRVREQLKEREGEKVQIVDYKPEYREIFKTLNVEWISTYFKMEPADYKALDDPEGYILNNGGFIFIALYDNNPVGVCAMVKMNDPEYDYELAKMAVSPAAHGKSIGWLLGLAVVERARSLNASKLYLESNTILKPAISLYHKLGFNKVAGRYTPYERANIQMELVLKKNR